MSSASIRCVRPTRPHSRAPSSSHRPTPSAAAGGPISGCPGFDGRGVTIALLDTGVDVTHPFIRDRLLDGVDVLDPDARAVARPHPNEPMRFERHGTQVAGLLVGSGGPAGIRGVAPGATILPIRVAGWQPSAEGGFAVYSRTDQLLAGLELAVDPDADGDVLDAARIAVVGVTEPFAAFPDGPVARAVAGASRLDTLVVVPAGNEGPAGPGYGSIGGPGGAPAALTVGAADLRRETAVVRVVVRAGPARPARPRAAARWRRRAAHAARAGGDAAAAERRLRSARDAARPLLRRQRLQPRRRPCGVPRARRRAYRRRARGRARGRGGDPRRRPRPGRRSRPRRPTRRPGGGPPDRRGRRAPRGDRARHRRPRLARRARLAGQRAARVDRTVLLARPRVRRRCQAGGRSRRCRARHRRSGPERRSDGALRHDQRLERGRGARRWRGRRARTGATRARRGGPEGSARRHRRPGRPAARPPPRAAASSTSVPRPPPRSWPTRPRSASARPTSQAGELCAGSRSGTSPRDGWRSWSRLRRRESPASR